MTTEPSELEATYRRCGDRMWRAIVASFGEPELASDAVAEAFAQAARRQRSATAEPITDLEAWLWRTVFRVANGLATKRPLRLVNLDQPDNTNLSETDWDLVEALQALPPTQREAIVLRHMGGWSVDDVATHLNSTPGSIRAQVSKGLARLRTALETTDVH